MAIQHSLLTPISVTFFRPLLALLLLPSLGFALPLEYSASYNLEKFGMVIAKSDYSLRHENNGVRMTQHTQPVGLAALLRDDTLDENSFLSTQDDQLLLTEFSYRQISEDKKNRNIQLKINWTQSGDKPQGLVRGNAYGKKLKLKVENPVWDTSSYQIPLMLNTKEEAAPQKYTMMVKGKFHTYTFITHGSEKIEVNGNIIQTIKVERDSSKKKSPIYLWLAPSLNNLPVKIEKWKNGTLQLTLLLNQAQFPSDKSMEFKTVADELEEF